MRPIDAERRRRGNLRREARAKKLFGASQAGKPDGAPGEKGREVSWRLVAPSEDAATNQEAQVPPEPKQLGMHLTLEARDLSGERSKPINGVGGSTGWSAAVDSGVPRNVGRVHGLLDVAPVKDSGVF